MSQPSFEALLRLMEQQKQHRWKAGVAYTITGIIDSLQVTHSFTLKQDMWVHGPAGDKRYTLLKEVHPLHARLIELEKKLEQLTAESFQEIKSYVQRLIQAIRDDAEVANQATNEIILRHVTSLIEGVLNDNQDLNLHGLYYPITACQHELFGEPPVSKAVITAFGAVVGGLIGLGVAALIVTGVGFATGGVGALLTLPLLFKAVLIGGSVGCAFVGALGAGLLGHKKAQTKHAEFAQKKAAIEQVPAVGFFKKIETGVDTLASLNHGAPGPVFEKGSR